VFAPLSTAVIAVSVGVILLSALYALLNRLINDGLLAAIALLEVLLIVQAVVGIGRIGHLSAERATFAAYLFSLPFVTPMTTLLAIKEKTRWSMVTIGVGAFAVAVMTVRLGQIWSANA
jgi:hypothetical protein